ncbi:hypothetical protein [Plantactinospora sp. CA-290183]|uniref:hypothetical protein n=1 Tax=Plantactinospora sp. CA-290183 TaxID=3240006 RepID=UPI003D932A7B
MRRVDPGAPLMLGTVLAHGVGGRQDLPIPFAYAVTGAALALVISFLALGALWREPRLADPGAGRPLPAGLAGLVDSAGCRWALRGLGLLLAAYFCLGLFLGPDDERNPTAGTLYILFWVGLVPLSLLFGPVWRLLNPLRTLHLLGCAVLRRDRDRGPLALAPGLGYWPAAVGLTAFVWLELVAPDRATLPVIRAWLICYAVGTLVAATLFGARWFDRGDAFEAYSGLVGRLAPLGRRDDGTLVWRNPLEGMATLRAAPGLTATVVVLLGSTLFDSLVSTPGWARFTYRLDLSPTLVGTLGLGAVVGAVLAVYVGACALAARLAGADRAGQVAGRFAHSIVPIAVGYVLAHYYSLLVVDGQRTLSLLSDPLVTGADWLGTRDWVANTALITPASVATLQVTLIVLGHLLGTVLSHDRTLEVFPGRSALAAQVPLLVLMVGYTVAGLLLLFAG